MTLKEKFLPKMYCFMGSGMLTNSYDQKIAEDNAKECEQIADEFAIGFVRFINETDSYHHGEDAFHFDGKWHTYEQFLKIYKKEK